MKNLFKGTILVICFAISIAIIEMSCSKSDAQPTQNSQNNQNSENNNQNNAAQLNKVIYVKYVSGGDPNMWVANYDGTGQTQVTLSIPTVRIANDLNSFAIRLSPDGQKIFFMGYDVSVTPYPTSLYSCNIDGSNVQAVISSTTEYIKFGGAY